MTAIQRQALAVMDEANAGAIRIGDRWIWREDIRTDEFAAILVVSAVTRQIRTGERVVDLRA
ncbi:MAG TPA: hypothetical protein VD713_07880 [Sphingomonadales bacterium]|nr:hypothetical protein [Sphingomonadales bacterium]